MDPRLGGVCEAVRITVKKLNELEVCNEIVSLDSPNASFLAKEKVMIHALGPGRTPWCYSGKLIPWLIKHASRFDAIILHGLWLFPSFAVRKALQYLHRQDPSNKAKRPKIFIMPHGMLDPYFQRAQNRRLKAIRNWIYWKLIEGRVIKNANGLLFTCEEELFLARTTFSPYRPQKEMNVGLGIAQPPSYSNRMRNSFLESCPGLNNETYILFLGRIHPKKGIDILFKAYDELLRSTLQLINYTTYTNNAGLFNGVYSHDIKFPKLVIAGPGWDTPYGVSIKKLVEGNSLLNGFIYFPDMLVDEEKWGAIYGCEAFILPSHQENFGIAVVEALSCGKPVLISNQINIWKEIQELRCGIIKPDTLDGVKELFSSWLCLSHEEKKYMNEKARLAYEHKFSIGSVAVNLLNIIKE
ncbi:glycosyltransferase [Flavisolibacter tropicus]|nr:glycosyltransferase [Flavisolibacter tropicus]